MNLSRGAVWGVAVVVLVTAVLAGPVVQGVDVTRDQVAFGGGDATVADVELVDVPALDAGRFGTDVHYLRGATARATVRDVTGRPRLVLRVQAPELDYDETATTVVRAGDRGPRVLSVDDVTVENDAVPGHPVVVQTTVRVQSFDGDSVVHRTNHTVGGGR